MYPQCTLQVAANVSDESCPASCDGRIKLTVTGGTPAYTYSWSDGQTISMPKNLCPGTYTCVVSDFAGCADTSVYVIAPSTYILTIIKTNLTCFGQCDGSLYADASGGSPVYTYSWSPGGQTTDNLNNLCQGTYTVSITDSKSCVIVRTVSITEPQLLTAGIVVTDASCSTCNDGSMTVSADGGNKPYNYLWQPGNFTTAKLMSMGPGTYTVCVTDKNGCTVCTSGTVNAPVGIDDQTLSEQIKVYQGASPGYIMIEIPTPINAVLSISTLLGMQVYQSEWNNNDSKRAIQVDHLSSGVYLFLLQQADGSVFARKLDLQNIH